MHRKSLEKRRAPAIEAARALLDRREFDAAVAAVRAADDSIYGNVALARLFEQYLADLMARSPRPEKARLEEVFKQAALRWCYAYPDPHTAIEREQFDAGLAEDRARLVKVLGYDPGE